MKRNLYNVYQKCCFLLLPLLLCGIAFTAQGQNISTVAGNGTAGYTGDGGAATSAQIWWPTTVAADGSGGFYIGSGWTSSSTTNSRIRRVTASGTIYTYAGTGTAGFSGDGGQATAAQIGGSTTSWWWWGGGGVASDAAGNLYIADQGNYRIRKVNTSGIITTVAGNGGTGYTGDGGQATAADIGWGTSWSWGGSIASDPSGNLYIFCWGYYKVRRIDASSGIITTIAGTGTYGFSGDGGAATAANLGYIYGLCADGYGNVYLADWNYRRIRMINSSGVITTVAGSGAGGFSGDGGPATAAAIAPLGVAVDGAGNMNIADYGNNRIRKVDASGTITTIAGTGTYNFSGDGGPATAATFRYPYNLCVDAPGNVYICDYNNVRIRKITNFNRPPYFTAGASVNLTVCQNTTFDSVNTQLAVMDSDSFQPETWSLVSGFGPFHGTAAITYTTPSTGAVLTPHTLSYTPATGYSGLDTFRVRVNDGYVFDTIIVYVTVNPIPSAITGAASMSVGGYSILGSTPSGGSWSSGSTGVATAGAGTGLVTGVSSGIATITYTLPTGCIMTRTVNVFPYAGHMITTIAGNGTAGYLADGVAATSTRINQPWGTATDAAGNVYIADASNNRIRKVNTFGVISTIAGTGTAGFSGDGGAATAAMISHPYDVATDAAGNVYIADDGNNRVRKINTSGVISTIAGTGSGGHSGDGGQATAATFTGPSCVELDPSGNIYISVDGTRIRKINTSGIISTFAGTSTAGFGGDGGAATAAQLDNPVSVAADGSGNILIADQLNHRIRRVNSGGVISTIAGTGTGSFSGDGSAAVSATLNYPWGIVVDALGNIFIGDQLNNRVRQINTTGTITTIAGNGTGSYGGDACAATASQLYHPGGLSVDNTGAIYVADVDNNRVRKVSHNQGPVFTGGRVQSLSACQNMLVSVNTIMAVSDIDNNQGLVWTVLQAPVNGTLVASYTATSNGGTITPTGLSYTPTTGFTGSDSFKVRVNDCGVGSDTTVVYVTVNPPPAPIAGAPTVCPGLTTLYTDAVSGGLWSSSDPSIATVGALSGLVTGIATGTATITYSPGAGCSATKTISVSPAPAAITGWPHICLGAPSTFSNATTGGVWSSSNTGIVTIGSTTGLANGVAAGTATITYLQGGCPAVLAVTVNPVTPLILGVPTVCVGGTTLLFGSGGGTWSSLSPAVGTIAGTGLVTGMAPGTTTIRYTRSTGCFASTSVVVHALPLPITGPGSVCIGQTITLSDATPSGVWSKSTLSSFAAVDSFSGVVTGISAGTETISYTDLVSECSVTYPVSVNPAPPAISGTTSVCVGQTTPLFNTTTGGTWASSATGTATVGSTTGVVSGIATGTATISYTAGGCTTTIVVTVTPGASAITGSGTVCVGLSTTLSSPGGGTWSTSGSTATVGSSSGIVTGVLPGTALITYTLSTGCTSTRTITINTSPGPVLGTLSLCPAGTTALSNAISGGTWSSGTPSVATIGTSGIVSSLLPGTTVITYSLGAGCSNTATVTVNPLPATITGLPSVCAGGTTPLSNSTPGGTWSASGSAATVGSTTGLVSGINPGTSVITYTAAGCNRSVTVTINPLPAPPGGPSVVCIGQPATLTTTTPGCTWTSGSPSIATVGSSSGIVTGVTTGTVTIVCSIAGTGCSRSKVMTVNPLPASISGPAQVCEGASITLTNSSPGGSWSTSSSTASVGATSGLVSGITAGTAVISYTISTGCWQSRIITINPLPAAISGPSALCVGAGVAQTSTPGGTWISTTPSVATIGSSSGIVLGVATGTTLISYTLPTGCRITRTVTVSTSPTGITGAPSVCVGDNTTLGNAIGGGLWSSSSPAVGTVGSLSGVVTGISTGMATITYSLGSGCTVTHLMSVQPSPAAITGSSNVCIGATTSLSDATPGGTWSSSAGTTASVTSGGVVSGVAAGTATISYTVSGCSATRIVSVNASPSAITGPTQVCVGSVITAVNSVPGGLWSTGSTILTIGSGSGDVTGVSLGTATITYSIGGCIATRTISVNGVSAISGATGICIGTSSTLTATGGGTWTSSTPGVATIGATSGIVTGIATGTSAITYLLGTGCSATVTVTVNNAPGAITGILQLCSGYTSALSNTVGGGTWSSGNLTRATIGSTSGIVTGVGPGTVTITYSLGSGCAVTAIVTVNAVPTAISGPGQVCEGSAITLSNPTPGGTWSSSSTGTATVGATSGSVSGILSGVATISYTTGGSCAAIKTVTVNMAPGAITGPGNVCVSQSITLGNSVAGGTWSSGSTPIATVIPSTGIVSGVIPGTSIITYTLSSGCTATKIITVNAAPGAITGSMQVCIGSTTALSNGTPGGTWNSDNPSVATVGSSGIVSGISLGTATISYSVGGCPATTTVSVNGLPGAIAGPGAVCEGSAVTLTDPTPGGTWSSGNTLIATAEATTGIIHGVASGTVTISYSMGAGCTVSRSIVVRPLPLPITGSTNLCIGATTSLSSATPGGVWSSSAPWIASIGSSGAVTAVSGGAATISYTAATGCAVTVAVNVIIVPAITGINDICAWGDTVSINNTNGSGIYSSSLVTVLNLGGGNGLVTGFAPGTGTIVYTLAGSGCYTSATITVNPLPGPITGNNRLCTGLTTTLGNSVPGGIWSSSSTGAATIGSGTGIVTGLAPGTEHITYTLQPTGCRADTIVIVNPAPSAISGVSQLCAGTTVTLTDTIPGGVWSSSNPLVATAVAGVVPGTATVSGLSSGVVTVTYTMGASCMATSMVTVNALPFVYTVTGGGNYCSGGAGLHVLQSGSQIGIDYQLYNGATATGTPVSGTTTTLDFGPQTAAGTYTVLATHAASTCARTMSGSANITITPSVVPGVTLSATPGSTLCVGTAATFTATGVNTGTAPVYEWLLNGVTIAGTTSTTYSYTPAHGDIVKAVLTSNAVCASPDTAAGAVTMTVNDMLVPVVTITAVPGTTVITGKPVTFTAVVVNGGPAPTYQWKVNGVAIAGATGAVFTWSSFTTGDVVTCDVTSSGPCGGQGDVSNPLSLTVTPDPVVGVHTVAGEGVVQVQPNPNKGTFTIRGTLGVTTEEEVMIEITNMLGQVVYKDRVLKQNGRLDKQVKLSATLANGMYMLNLRSDSEQKVFHIVVEQ